MENETIIEIRDLAFSFNGNPVLEGVNLTVKQGDFLAVIGPNGGGKTTLIKLILGLLKPEKGTIRVFGRSPKELSHNIGYVPQESGLHRSFPISVLDAVLMGRVRGGGGWRRLSRGDHIEAQKALERVDMWPLRRRRMGELSGGQRQRVFVARSLVTEPEILFLDEPMASVDAQGQTDFYSFLRELNKTVTVILVSHDLSIISSHVKSVACVNQQLIFHDAAEITGDMLDMAYCCPVDLIAHGKPHRVLRDH
ncbi:metal ABC transporter ATP-binding protein [Thermodesulfobacteriota bacterium]